MSRHSVYRFGDFRLDVADRRLSRAGDPVDLPPRYFDALVLLVREAGRLVAKDRFFAEIWGDVAVGDEALTQCIKTLRRQLGDDAARPRFVQTVPKHGYRFIPAVAAESEPTGASAPNPPHARMAAAAVTPARHHAGIVATTAATAISGAVAGLVGGVLYGALLILPAEAEMGGTSFAALLLALNVLVGGLAGLGVGLGYSIAAAFTGLRLVHVLGAAIGGLAVGEISRLLGLDAFNLLLGEAPVGITGGAAGAFVGGLLVLGFVAGRRERHRLLGATVAGGVAGLMVVAVGSRLMAGSLERIAATLSDTGALAPFAPFFANAAFGYWPEIFLGGIEGLVFGGAIAAALILVERRSRASG